MEEAIGNEGRYPEITLEEKWVEEEDGVVSESVMQIAARGVEVSQTHIPGYARLLMLPWYDRRRVAFLLTRCTTWPHPPLILHACLIATARSPAYTCLFGSCGSETTDHQNATIISNAGCCTAQAALLCCQENTLHNAEQRPGSGFFCVDGAWLCPTHSDSSSASADDRGCEGTLLLKLISRFNKAECHYRVASTPARPVWSSNPHLAHRLFKKGSHRR